MPIELGLAPRLDTVGTAYHNVAVTSCRYLSLSTAVWFLACPWLLWPTFVPLLTVLFLILLLGFRLGSRRWQGRFLRSTALGPFLFFYLVAAGIGYLISPAPALGLAKVTTLALGTFGYFLTLDWLSRQDERIWSLLHLLLAAAGGLVALSTPFVMIWPTRQILDLTFLAARVPHLGGDLSVHSNEIGGTLLFLMPFGVVLLYERGHHRRKWQLLGVLLILLMLCAMLLAQSRSALLGMFVAVAAALVWSRLRLSRLVAGTLAILLLILVAVLVLGIGVEDVSQWIERLDAQTKSGPVQATSWAMRREIWQAGWSMLGDYAVFGAGLYAFVPVSKANYPFDAVPAGYSMTHAHNLFLHTAATLGWSALLALVGLWATVLQGLWREGKSGTRRPVVYGASLVGYLAFNSLDMIALGQRPGILLWIILAGAVVSGKSLRRSTAQWKQVAPLLLWSGLALTPLLSRNVANWRLDQVRLAAQKSHEISAEAYLGDPRRQGLVFLLQGDADQALRHWRSDHHGVIYLQSQGLERAAVGDYEAAIDWYEWALRLDDRRATLYFWRGIARLQRGSQKDARADFQRAASYALDDGLDEAWQKAIRYFQAQSQTRQDER